MTQSLRKLRAGNFPKNIIKVFIYSSDQLGFKKVDEHVRFINILLTQTYFRALHVLLT